MGTNLSNNEKSTNSGLINLIEGGNNLLCECGCGIEVKPNRRFVSGHNSRCMTIDTRSKLSSNLKGKTYEEIYGKEASEQKEKRAKCLRVVKIGKVSHRKDNG